MSSPHCLLFPQLSLPPGATQTRADSSLLESKNYHNAYYSSTFWPQLRGNRCTSSLQRTKNGFESCISNPLNVSDGARTYESTVRETKRYRA
jgi:hypothetical protein